MTYITLLILRGLLSEPDNHVCVQDPIVFVVHSLGGIVVKDVRLYLCRWGNWSIKFNTSIQALHKSETICKRTRLIIFLGTPHRGSTYASWGEIASNLASLGLQDSNKRLVQTLEVNGEVLDIIHEEFKTILSKSSIKCIRFKREREFPVWKDWTARYGSQQTPNCKA